MNINNSQGVLLSQNVINEKNLILTSGNLYLGTKNFLLSASSLISGSGYIVATNGGTLSKRFSNIGSFTAPLAENIGTLEYSPITINFTKGTFSNGVITLSVTDAKHNSTSLTANLSRYWSVSQTGISNFSCLLTGQYKDADITGKRSIFGVHTIMEQL